MFDVAIYGDDVPFLERIEKYTVGALFDEDELIIDLYDDGAELVNEINKTKNKYDLIFLGVIFLIGAVTFLILVFLFFSSQQFFTHSEHIVEPLLTKKSTVVSSSLFPQKLHCLIFIQPPLSKFFS